ncbi:MOB kinase activator 3B-like isoform X2 [Halichondria panicea]|uniref:MOB kinase activator 3B-like isoform X2 n=1 Tax=Halichondria panicea TaxID=6063 RepID=UPI00312B81C6
MASMFFSSKQRTFRPKKKWEKGSVKHDLHKKAKATLNSGLDLRQAVKLPDDEDYNDWLAVHVVDFFNRINIIYGTVCEFCTDETCPHMSGGPKFEYYWADEVQKKPLALSAPDYITRLMEWTEKQINNEHIFPMEVGTPFPKAFLPVCKKIFTRLYRVFVHVYIHHFEKVVAIGAEAHVNSCYKHFYFFITEFNLADSKEFEPLKDLNDPLRL